MSPARACAGRRLRGSAPSSRTRPAAILTHRTPGRRLAPPTPTRPPAPPTPAQPPRRRWVVLLARRFVDRPIGSLAPRSSGLVRRASQADRTDRSTRQRHQRLPPTATTNSPTRMSLRPAPRSQPPRRGRSSVPALGARAPSRHGVCRRPSPQPAPRVLHGKAVPGRMRPRRRLLSPPARPNSSPAFPSSPAAAPPTGRPASHWPARSGSLTNAMGPGVPPSSSRHRPAPSRPPQRTAAAHGWRDR